MHGDEDIATADELAVEVELGDGGPVGELLDALAQVGVLEDVEGGELGRVDALQAENLDAGPREPALGRLGRALHEEDHGRGSHGLLDGLPRLVREESPLERTEEGRWPGEGIRVPR